MTIEEIFSKIASHMIKGIMYHNEFAKAYNFLGLWGMAKCHIHHQFEEEFNYVHLSHYYATHQFKLIHVEELPKLTVIPDTWYKYTTQDVDTNTKKNAVKDLMLQWINWEKETKQFYSDMRHELMNLGEVAAALHIEKYLQDVDKELSHAQKKLIKLETVNYDWTYIIDQQKLLEIKYDKKLNW